MKLLQSYAAACLYCAKLGAVGAAVDAAGYCSTSKLGFYALSSSICCTIALLSEAVLASPFLCSLKAGEG